jgi:hypothetical protein
MTKVQRTGPAQPDHVDSPEDAKQAYRDSEGRPHLTPEQEQAAKEAEDRRDDGRPPVPGAVPRSSPD